MFSSTFWHKPTCNSCPPAAVCHTSLSMYTLFVHPPTDVGVLMICMCGAVISCVPVHMHLSSKVPHPCPLLQLPATSPHFWCISGAGHFVAPAPGVRHGASTTADHTDVDSSSQVLHSLTYSHVGPTHKAPPPPHSRTWESQPLTFYLSWSIFHCLYCSSPVYML